MKTILMATMAMHFAVFQSKIALAGVYEKREEPNIKSVADAIDKIAGAFDEYKKTNDQRLEAIKTGTSTESLDAKLAAMDERLNSLSEMKSRLEKMETKLARPGAWGGDEKDQPSLEASEYKHVFLDWMRSPQDPERKAAVHEKQKALEAKARATEVLTKHRPELDKLVKVLLEKETVEQDVFVEIMGGPAKKADDVNPAGMVVES